MAQEKLSRLQLLNQADNPLGLLTSTLERHGILLGKLIHEVGSGNVLYGIEDPTVDADIITHAAIAAAHHAKYLDSAALAAIAGAVLYTRIDGSLAFTDVVAGVAPTDAAHLATKEYVDSAITFIGEYHFNNTASSYAGIFFKMLDTHTGEAEASFVSGSLGEADDQALVNFATDPGVPGLTCLGAGIYTGHIYAKVDASNKRPVKLHFEIYTKLEDDPFTETLIATSEESDFLTDTQAHYDIHAVLAADADLAATDRLVVKWLANVGSPPNNDPIVTLYVEGSNHSRLSVPISSEVLSQIYLRQDGSKVGSTSEAQDFGPNGIKTDVIAESTGAAGVAIDDVRIKDDDLFLGKDQTSSDVKLRNTNGNFNIRLGDDSDWASFTAKSGLYTTFAEALYYRLTTANPADIEISGGVVVPTHQFHNLQAQAGVEDDLTTLAFSTGRATVIYLIADAGDTITLKHASVNLLISGGADLILVGDDGDLAIGIYDPGTTKCHIIGGFRPHASDHTDGTDNIQDAAADDSTKGIATFEADDFDDASGKIDLADSVAKAITGDSGTGTPSGHSIKIEGGTRITTVGSAAKVVINLDTLYSVHQYVFTPDAAPGEDVETGAHQGTIHVSGPSNETVKRITVICEEAAGTAFTFTLDYDSGNDDFDSFAVDTEIDEVAVGTAKGVVVTGGFTNATIVARSLISFDITVVTGDPPTDVTVILEVWRPLQT